MEQKNLSNLVGFTSKQEMNPLLLLFALGMSNYF